MIPYEGYQRSKNSTQDHDYSTKSNHNGYNSQQKNLLDQILPPPNPIMIKKNEEEEEDSRATLKLVLQKPDDKDNINNNHSSDYYNFHKELRENSGKKNPDFNEYSYFEYNESIFGYIDQLKAEIVYKKFDNSKNNTLPLDNVQYFAGIFCDLKNLINKKILINHELRHQIDLIHYVLKDQYKESENEDNSDDQNNNNNQWDITYPSDLNNQFAQQSLSKILENKQLLFDSQFESGNLLCALKRSENEYDLILQNDINSKGNTQWFYFSVSNASKNQAIKFNIVNLLKNDSLFNYGMMPVCFSMKKNEKTGEGWFRGGYNISYQKNQIEKETSNKCYYSLTFSYKFEHSEDKVYFAQCFPYTFTDLQTYISKLQRNQNMKSILKVQNICKTICNNSCELLTITSNVNSTSKDKKKVVVFLARQHPGETPGSFMMEGVLDFLTDIYNKEAEFLRQHYIFKIVPMINPDGVIHGNYRCSLAGVDLNRKWDNPSKELHPSVYFTKQLIIQLNLEKRISYIIDLHGHSKKMNSFFYGNPNQDDPSIPRLLPLIASNINQDICFKSCKFKLSQDKNSAMRQSLFLQLSSPTTQIFTFEASFFGREREENNFNLKQHFTIQDLKKLGSDICTSIYNITTYELSENQKPSNGSTMQIDQGKESMLGQLKQQLREMQQCGLQNNDDKAGSSGSDSNPTGDELTKKELKSFYKSKQDHQNSQKKQITQGLNNFVQNNNNNSISLQQSRLQQQYKEDKLYQQSCQQQINLKKKLCQNQLNYSKKIFVVDRATQTEEKINFSLYMEGSSDLNLISQQTNATPRQCDLLYRKSTNQAHNNNSSIVTTVSQQPMRPASSIPVSSQELGYTFNSQKGEFPEDQLILYSQNPIKKNKNSSMHQPQQQSNNVQKTNNLLQDNVNTQSRLSQIDQKFQECQIGYSIKEALKTTNNFYNDWQQQQQPLLSEKPELTRQEQTISIENNKLIKDLNQRQKMYSRFLITGQTFDKNTNKFHNQQTVKSVKTLILKDSSAQTLLNLIQVNNNKNHDQLLMNKVKVDPTKLYAQSNQIQQVKGKQSSQGQNIIIEHQQKCISSNLLNQQYIQQTQCTPEKLQNTLYNSLKIKRIQPQLIKQEDTKEQKWRMNNRIDLQKHDNTINVLELSNNKNQAFLYNINNGNAIQQQTNCQTINSSVKSNSQVNNIFQMIVKDKVLQGGSSILCKQKFPNSHKERGKGKNNHNLFLDRSFNMHEHSNDLNKSFIASQNEKMINNSFTISRIQAHEKGPSNFELKMLQSQQGQMESCRFQCQQTAAISSLQQAKHNRQARKVFNIPFNQRFIEKLLK